VGEAGFAALPGVAGDGAAGAGESTDFIDEAPEMGVLGRGVARMLVLA